MPFAEMMGKTMEAKKGGSPFNCAEMMSQMMEARKSGSPFDCAEVMSRMTPMCGGCKEEDKGRK